jgi:magnesium-transporting ATPase (P-type)
MMSLHSTVRRDGTRVVIDSAQLVCGDIVLLEEGNKVPADGYLLHINNLEI